MKSPIRTTLGIAIQSLNCTPVGWGVVLAGSIWARLRVSVVSSEQIGELGAHLSGGLSHELFQKHCQ